MTKPLSPAAQAVMDAYHDAPVIGVWPGHGDALGVAAALRAAVYQVSYEDELGLTAFGGHAQAQNQTLAIAAELEGIVE